MILSTLLSGALLATPAPSVARHEPLAELLAIRVGRAETITQGTLKHAVVLVEGGKITAVGEDLPIERGIPILDRPDWVLTPGLVDCYSRMGLDGQAGRDFAPEGSAADELFMEQDVYADVLETGVTTLGLYPAGTGIPGTAVAIRPRGKTAAEAIVSKDVYLKVFIGADADLKKMFRDAFDKVAEYNEKVAKAKEKWEKDQEKAKSKKKDDKEGEKSGDDEAKQEEVSKTFVPPEADPKVQRFLDFQAKRFPALMRIQKAADFLHLLDVVEGREIEWMVRCPLRDDIDLFEVDERVGQSKAIIVLEPVITLQPSTRRDRNIPAEMARAGARVAFVPRRDDPESCKLWLKHVGELLRAGLSRQDAPAAVTLVPAEVLGLEERLGSLDVGKDANLILWNGDPFEPGSRIESVMLEGEWVYQAEEKP